MRATILIVDDEAAIRQMLRLALGQAGFHCLEAADAEGAWARLVEQRPDLILLDWMLPGVSGIDFARRLRGEALTRSVPIILLTARAEEDDRVRGLEGGADDYVTKPFSTRELIARCRALLRRAAPHVGEATVAAGGLHLDPATHRVLAGTSAIELGPTEFRLLHFFMAHPERVHSRERLLNAVWGDHVHVEERTVDVHILRLRKALAHSGHERLIQTVRGAGYRFSGRG